jgi:hypothetical protein
VQFETWELELWLVWQQFELRTARALTTQWTIVAVAPHHMGSGEVDEERVQVLYQIVKPTLSKV